MENNNKTSWLPSLLVLFVIIIAFVAVVAGAIKVSDHYRTPVALAPVEVPAPTVSESAPVATATMQVVSTSVPAPAPATILVEKNWDRHFWAVAVNHCDSGLDWRKIADLNPNLPNRRFHVGQEVKLPPGCHTERSAPASSARVSTPTKAPEPTVAVKPVVVSVPVPTVTPPLATSPAPSSDVAVAAPVAVAPPAGNMPSCESEGYNHPDQAGLPEALSNRVAAAWLTLQGEWIETCKQQSGPVTAVQMAQRDQLVQSYKAQLQHVFGLLYMQGERHHAREAIKELQAAKREFFLAMMLRKYGQPTSLVELDVVYAERLKKSGLSKAFTYMAGKKDHDAPQNVDGSPPTENEGTASTGSE